MHDINLNIAQWFNQARFYVNFCHVCHRKWLTVLLIIIILWFWIHVFSYYFTVVTSSLSAYNHVIWCLIIILWHIHCMNTKSLLQWDIANYGGVRGLTTISRIKRNAVYSVIITLYCTSAGYYYIYSAISARVFNQIDTKLTTISWVRANITFINMLFVSPLNKHCHQQCNAH